ncbi:MAG: protein translocase subunit SecF, partial [Epsilonproteobacteria bacterium]|nr:protein translocase subunit SecF [Campylobacterota bacterium]
MEIFNTNKTYDFMGKSKIFISISIFFIIASYILLATKGLNYGLDFEGGTLVQVKYDKPAPIKLIRKSISKDKAFKNAAITKFGSDNEIIIRFSTSSASVKEDMGDRVRELLKGTGNFKIRRVDIVGPKVGGELREKGLMSMVLSIMAILIYVAFRFEWRFAVASVAALIHDVS